MIDRPARDRLAQLLRHVVSGQMSMEAFSDEAEQFAETTRDAGVLAVSEAVWALHSDAPFRPTGLGGGLRPSLALRRRLAIAALFLYTDADYEWPEIRRQGQSMDFLLLLACATFIIAGFVLLIPTTVVSPWWGIEAGICFLDALLLYAFSHWRAARCHANWVAAQRRMASHGPWPFRRRSDFREARCRPRLLGGRVAP